VARYLKAVGRRLDKLSENAGRDAQQMAVVHRVQDAYRLALAGPTPEASRGGGSRAEAATEIRWQIEELRVSLFAQTIGTPVPVSERRILTSIDQLT
jgi:ATP-dependent helicase HrpA